MKLTVLCGGVGGSKLVLGLYEEFPAAELMVIVNTADDLDLYGLHISPDLDTVSYTLAGAVNPTTGWGLEDDTFNALAMLERYGHDPWFKLGDKDIATHLTRTAYMRAGHSLTEATALLAQRLGVRAQILPMTDDPVATRVRVAEGWLSFQEYFVKRGHADIPLEVEQAGAQTATIPDGVPRAISEADVIVVAPSNPVVSIGPMLAIPGFVDCLAAANAPKIAVSPFLGMQSITGPADALMRTIGSEPSAIGLARHYRAWLDEMVVHPSDASQVGAIEALGVRAYVTDILLPDLAAKRRLARFLVEAAHIHA